MAGFDPDPTLGESSGSSDEDPDDFPLKRFTINFAKAIGQGSFGTVYKGKDTRTRQTIAAKMIRAKKSKDISCVLTEIKNIQRIKSHPNIVQLFDFAYFNSAFWMIMEYCDLGDLAEYFKKYNPDMNTILEFSLMCAKAIAHMHGQDDPVIHRDIKPANILVKSPAILFFGEDCRFWSGQDWGHGQNHGTNHSDEDTSGNPRLHGSRDICQRKLHKVSGCVCLGTCVPGHDTV